MRRRKNDGLPKYVSRRSYGVIYQPYLGRKDGKTLRGKPVNLGPVDMSVPEIWAAYNRETKQDNDTLRWLLTEYHQSKKFKSLKPKTQGHYEGYRDALLAKKMRNGKPFGTAQLSAIKRTVIQQLIDKADAPISVNRQVQYLKAAWNWALNRYDHIPENPCIGVELNKQEARTRYVTQQEFRAFAASASGYIPHFMELAYLCRARWSEVAALQQSDLLPEGVRVERGKGSDSEITAWTPRLRAAIENCKAHNKGAPTPLAGAFLLHDRQGAAIKQNAFQSAWGRAMRKWVAAGNERFTFHDLKAAAYSDMKDPWAGHKSERMHDVYMRKLRVVEPPE